MSRRFPVVPLLAFSLLAGAFSTPASAGPVAYAGRAEWAFASWLVADERRPFAYTVTVRRTVGPLPTEVDTAAVIEKRPCTVSHGDYFCSAGRRLRVELETDEFWLSPALTEAHMEFEHRGSVFEADWVYRGGRQPAIFAGGGPRGAGAAVWHSGWYARVKGRLFGQRLQPSEGRGILDTWTSAGARAQ